MGDKRFSQVVDWNKHIEPYRIIQFVAGVGSKKNDWVVFKKRDVRSACNDCVGR